MSILIKITDKIVETPSTCSFRFEAIDGEFKYQEGQFITLEIPIGKSIYKRSYSLSSCNSDDFTQFTVKRVQDGLVSNFLLDKVAIGSLFRIQPPKGYFVLPKETKYYHYGFIAAGSGITPIFSMIKSLLETQPLCTIYLLYSVNSPEETIFFKEISALVNEYNGQFYLDIVLTKGYSKSNSFLGSFLKKGDPIFQKFVFASKRINFDTLKQWIEYREISIKESEFYICGPEGLIDQGLSFLKMEGIPDENTHFEYFNTTVSDIDENAAKSQVTVIFEGQTIETSLERNMNVLDKMLDLGYDMPYSCKNGACSTCIAKLLSGEVKMKVSQGLDPDEIDQGYILTCQALIISEKAVIEY